MSPAVTSPNPNPPDTNIVSDAWDGIKSAPRWVFVAIIGGGIAIWYGFTRIKPVGKSIEGIEGKGIDSVISDNSFSPISNREGEQTQNIAYWYVDVAPAGWASTLNGIATQFYGNTNRVGDIQKHNPNIKQQPYDRLPTGLKVKVPR